jgi:SPP1 Gp6-like portal protein
VALSDEAQATLRRLKSRLDRDMRGWRCNGHAVAGFLSLRAYYQGTQRLAQLGLAVPEELRQFTTIVAWPRTYVDAIASRLRPQGFLLDGEADNDLWDIWQANNLDSEIRMAIVDMLAFRRGYLAVGESDASPLPLVTVESPFQMVHEWSNRYRRVSVAARFYLEDVDGKKERRATLYEPNVTTWLVYGSRGWEQDPDEEPDEHGLGRVPVYPMVNRAATDDRYGESEMQPIIGLTDAAARALTNAQVATEVMALPQRWAAGMTQADFKDAKTGEILTAWETYFGAIWGTGNKDAKFGQFEAASLDNFKTVVGMWAQQVAGVTGLPMRYLGQLSDNPPSADGIRADESRLVGTAEEKQEFCNLGLEGAMSTARFIQTGEDDPEMAKLQTDWRDPATPTIAQAADAAVKLHAQGLVSRREALRALGKSPKQIELIEQELKDESDDPLLAQALKDVSNAASVGA